MKIQVIRGISVTFRPYPPEDSFRCCTPNGYDGPGRCAFYHQSQRMCPGQTGEGPCTDPGGTWVTVQALPFDDEQAQDSTVPSMVAP